MLYLLIFIGFEIENLEAINLLNSYNSPLHNLSITKITKYYKGKQIFS